ncbi:glycosyltransferase [Bremerella sp. T1]
MANVAVAWELGGGLGHLGVLAPLVRELKRKGHQISLISRNLATSVRLFGGGEFPHFQAPVRTKKSANPIDRPLTYGDMLLNLGYEDEIELLGLFEGWKGLFSLLKPDIVLHDHSPTAMLASLSLQLPAFTIGTGFCQPPPIFPLPPMAWWRPHDPMELAERESSLIDRIHRTIPGIEQPLTGLGRLFELVQGNFLTTFCDLDHYPSRQDAQYFGSWSPPLSRSAFTGWRPASGKKIFAYLKRMPCLGDLIRWLSESGHSVVVVGDRIDFTPLRKLVSNRIQLLDKAIDLTEIKKTCDLAILNGNHGVTCEFLLAGVPILQIPLMQEQSILSHVTVQKGFAFSASASHVPQVISQLNAALTSKQLQENSSRFASQLGSYDAEAQQHKIVETICAAC